jgi:hypothetical protein
MTSAPEHDPAPARDVSLVSAGEPYSHRRLTFPARPRRALPPPPLTVTPAKAGVQPSDARSGASRGSRFP